MLTILLIADCSIYSSIKACNYVKQLMAFYACFINFESAASLSACSILIDTIDALCIVSKVRNGVPELTSMLRLASLSAISPLSKINEIFTWGNNHIFKVNSRCCHVNSTSISSENVAHSRVVFRDDSIKISPYK